MGSASNASPVLSLLGDRITWTNTRVLVGAIAGDFFTQGSPILVNTFVYGPVLTPPLGDGQVPTTTPGDRGWYIPVGWEPGTPLPDQPEPAVIPYEVFSTTTATWSTAQDSSPGVGFFLVKDLSAVPEPSAWLLMGVGLVGLFAASRRRQPS